MAKINDSYQIDRITKLKQTFSIFDAKLMRTLNYTKKEEKGYEKDVRTIDNLTDFFFI